MKQTYSQTIFIKKKEPRYCYLSVMFLHSATSPNLFPAIDTWRHGVYRSRAEEMTLKGATTQQKRIEIVHRGG